MTPCKAVLICALMAPAVAAAQILADTEPPSVSPLAALERRAVPMALVEGTIRDGALRVERTTITLAAPPPPRAQALAAGGATVRLLDREGNLIEAVPIDDPRIVHELEGEGRTFLETDGSFALGVPLDDRAAGQIMNLQIVPATGLSILGPVVPPVLRSPSSGGGDGPARLPNVPRPALGVVDVPIAAQIKGFCERSESPDVSLCRP